MRSFPNSILSRRIRQAGVATLLALLSITWSARAWNYETPFEFILEADLDGDGLTDVIIVDKETGAFRVGYQTVSGAPVWSDSRASGIDAVTGASVGRVLNTTRDTLVVTAPGANRINLIEAINGSAPVLPVSAFIPSLGPNLAAAIDIGGVGNTAHADLYITSRENPGSRETLLRNTGVARSLIIDTGLAQFRGSPNVFQPKSGSPSLLGLFNRATAPASDQFLALDLTAGTSVTSFSQTLTLSNAPRVPEFVSARFNNADLYAQLLFYQPGASNLLKYQLQASYSLTGSNSFNLSNRIQQVQVLTSVSGPRLLVLFGSNATNATVATVFSFDGVNPPVAVQSFTNANGFTGAGALGFGNFSLLNGDGSGRSAHFQNIGASGGGYTNGASGDLARVTPYSGGANVLMFAGEPFVLPTAKALKSVRTRDWSSAASLSGGVPPNVTVNAENYLNASNGLANPVATPLGAAPVGTTYALVNQYTNPISIFSRRSAVGDTAAEVSISPAAGEYTAAIKLTMTVNAAGWVIQYRLTPNAAWQTYASPVTLFSNATVQFYARDAGNTTKTPIRNAAYTFTVAANQIDSDGDGVPDAVELAKGLDPTKGPDSDGDGYPDLEELIRGTNPLDINNAPTNFPPTDFKQAFDLLTTPRSVDAVGAMSLSVTGVAVRAFGLDGRLMSTGGTTNYPVPPPGATNPAAPVNLVQPVAGEALVAQATDQHFDLNVGGDTRIGREMVGLITVPSLVLPTLPPVDFSLGVGAANAWISSAANIITNLPRTKVAGDITFHDTLAAVLFEAKIAEVLLARGTNYATNMTLFSFRPADVARTKVAALDLANIECYVGPSLPGYRLTNAYAHLLNSIHTNNSPAVTQLRTLAHTIYRLSAAHNNTNGSAFKLPVDELRLFLKTGGLESGYADFYSGGVDFALAATGASNLLATVPPRPTTNVIIEVVTAGPGVPTTFRVVSTATPVTLWQKDGTPCPLPPSFDVLPGSRLSLFGHKDIPGAGLPVEVITLSLTSVPIASDGDSNGDLLIDTWQGVFFGGGEGDAFADVDGDGYSNIQEMLGGSDPNNASSIPAGPVAPFALPAIGVTLGTQTTLTFDWPASYINSFKFGVRATPTLGSAFGDLVVPPPVNLGGNHFSITFPTPAQPQQFYVLTVALQP